jgi:hypothetical protein
MPGCVFVMQSASDDVAEDRIVWRCCKNNDGELGDRLAWIRCDGLFDSVSDFDLDGWNSDGQAVKIGVEIVAKIIEENRGARGTRYFALQNRRKRRLQRNSLSPN